MNTIFGKVVVTGGAGFIGSRLVNHLSKISSEVVVLDNLSTGSMENISSSTKLSKVKFLKADILDSEKTKTALKDAEFLFHEAAIVNVKQSFEQPELTNAVNVEGTKRLVDCAINSNSLEKIVFASSSAVYGCTNTVPTPEEAPCHPISPYGSSKILGEEIVLKLGSESGLNVNVLRYFNVYGEGSVPSQYSGVIVKFAERLSQGYGPIIFGDGSQTRDFIHIDDIANANIIVAKERCYRNRIYNVGTGASISITELARLEAQLFARRDDITRFQITYGGDNNGNIIHSCADITKIRTEVGFEPAISIEAGLRRYVSWFAKHKESIMTSI